MPNHTDPPPYHGGNLDEAKKRFGDPPNGWIDLSTGINPFSFLDTNLSPESLTRLPQEGAMSALMSAARTAYGVPDNVQLVAAGGSQALLQILPQLVPAGLCAVVGPTYGEHDYGWRQAGHEVVDTAILAECRDADTVVVVNPNNPDGRTFTPDNLIALADELTEKAGLLIIDEAFADVAPETSLIQHLRPGLRAIVLRSFGKFYGLAGLRLGFAVGHSDLVHDIERRLGPWAVNGAAIEIGTRALGDASWARKMRAQLAEQTREADRLLLESGFEVLGGTDLFRLARHGSAQGCFDALGQAGIFVRRFPEQTELLRFGLPGSVENQSRLQTALRNWSTSQ